MKIPLLFFKGLKEMMIEKIEKKIKNLEK